VHNKMIKAYVNFNEACSIFFMQYIIIHGNQFLLFFAQWITNCITAGAAFPCKL